MKPILTSCAWAAPAIVKTAAAAARNGQRLMGFLPDERLNGIPTSQAFVVQRPGCRVCGRAKNVYKLKRALGAADRQSFPAGRARACTATAGRGWHWARVFV